MAATLLGRIRWNLIRDKDGHRDYKVTHRVHTDNPDDGPQVVMNTPGLPAIGALWNFGNDFDAWAFCWPTMNVAVYHPKDGPNQEWVVEQLFSTKPLSRCQDTSIEDPLLEPQKVSGSFVKYTEEATKDRHGEPIKSSSHEMFRGPQVEFDHNRPTVRIEQNVATLGLETFSQMIDTVNDATLWGLEPRKIKLSNVSWERKLYGVCNFYYTRVFDFDIDFNTFDRKIIDEGTKVLNGHWDTTDECDAANAWILDNICGGAPDKDNPSHFVRYKDRNGENARVILDGNGQPLSGDILGTGTTTSPVEIDVEYYDESDFLLLGIPTSF